MILARSHTDASPDNIYMEEVDVSDISTIKVLDEGRFFEVTTVEEESRIDEALDVLERAEQDWDYLSGEERHGTVLQVLDILKGEDE